jgi:DNA-binding NarL/FixJ family response regulator
MPSEELKIAYEQKKQEFTKQLNEDIQHDLERMEEKKTANKKKLTDKQREVVEDLVSGLTVPQISEKRGHTTEVTYHYIKYIEKKGVTITPVKDGVRVLRYEVTGYNP